MIRAVIADDEARCRRALRDRLEREPDVQVVAEAADGNEAVEAIRSLRPDLVFLDVQMPRLNGFQVLEKVSEEHLPMVVFVTGYDVHVLKAFEFQSIDYLLKPYSESRFSESLGLARREIERGPSSPERTKLWALLEEFDATREGKARAGTFPRRFAVREGDRIMLVRAQDLDAVEAAGNYVTLVGPTRKHLLRLTLSEMEKLLDPSRFARVHRSTIINTDHVQEIRLASHGDCDVVLESGAVYRVSRVYRDKLLSVYGGGI